MKMNCWLILGVLAATSAGAQNSTNALPPIPPPAIGTTMAAPTAAPVVKATTPENKTPKKPPVARKKRVPAAAARPALAETTVALVPGPAEVAAANLNVRGQAGLKGEFIAHIAKGEAVTVLDQINLKKHTTGEPAQWAKIALPVSVKVWVRSGFIDETNKVVLPKKLNLRAGPGENYSVLGVIERGTPVSEVTTKGEWIQIEAPTNAYAFVAAIYLKQELSGTLSANPAPSAETEPPTNSIPTTLMTVAEPQPIVAETPTNATPAPEMSPAPAPATPVTAAPEAMAPAVLDTNLPPRVVTHQGYVRSSVSLVAPTYYELYDPENNVAIDYLFSTTTNLNLARYDGFQIAVTGQEGLDARWKDTPVLTIQKIYVLSTNAPIMKIYSSPRSPRASKSH
jgi:uncharacterized protein YgiM (DUF1202 family)